MNFLQFCFEELNIIPSDLEELMGFDPGMAPEPFPTLIEEILNHGSDLCDIRGGYQIFNHISINRQIPLLSIDNHHFSPGKTVINQLKNATRAALFVCTAGHRISDLALQKSREGDDLYAYILDITGSVAAEKAAELVQKKILEKVAAEGEGITAGYSPGYCSWSVAEQKILFSLLPPNPCNIALSDSSLMHPLKSVSGIVGIGTDCHQTNYQCFQCPDKQCIYGKIRRRKKAKKNH